MYLSMASVLTVTHMPTFIKAYPPLDLIVQRVEPALSSAGAVPEGSIPIQGFLGILGYSRVAIHALYF